MSSQMRLNACLARPGVLLAVTVAMLVGCTDRQRGNGLETAHVGTTHDPGAQFPTSGNFSFLERPSLPKDSRIDASALAARVQNALIQVLEEKGFSFGNVDQRLLVGFYVILHDKLDPGSRPIQQPASLPGREDKTKRLERATLILDLVDPTMRKTIWRSTYQADLAVDVSDEQKDARVRAVLRTMLERFPP